MSLPIDEMLSDLRAALEEHDERLCYDSLYKVAQETKRIMACCEEMLPEDAQ